MMVHGIVAVSVITALLPRMSAAAVDGELGAVAEHLSLGIRLSSVVLVPATILYIVLGIPLAVTAFQWGHFTADQAHATGIATIAAGIGLVPFAISQLQTFAFYAMRDTKTPALINIPVNVVRCLLYVVVYMALPAEQVVAGFMIANAVSYVVAVVVSAWLLRRRIGRLGLMRIVQTLTRLGLAAVAAGAIAGGLAYGLATALGEGKIASALVLIVGSGALVAAFCAGAVLVRVSEVTALWGMVRGRFLSRA
jgi:putative peptidoglycan lipid II flippase